ncbi:hypothetical protein [Phenylobacterium soli]|uniref:Restriction endonuclease type IV Mrr domain-containing protein n=1 Tax=Phenylobacterium soli TaxID=2170551 RepID=A0A328AB53_9CAUL|nr:hypothetical protein [Phenylobacterium soli]RAK51851.1 hypothetical protein DJ017_18725 [Phenylobacterium soli]
MSRTRKRLIVDFDEDLPEHLDELPVGGLDLVLVRFRYRFIGSSNSYLDVATDLLEASWIAEVLGAHARRMRLWMGRSAFHPSLTIALGGPQPGLGRAIQDAVLLWRDSDDDEPVDAERVDAERVDAIRERVADYEDRIHELRLRAPGLAGDYLANLVISYSESHSEAPEYMRAQYAKFPERRLGYFRSPSSWRFGGDCYSSGDGWILDRAVDLDRFFTLTHQTYRRSGFRPAQIVSLGRECVALAKGLLVQFPLDRYVRSQTAARLARDPHDEPWHEDPFAWRAEDDAGPFPRTACYVHSSGALCIVEDAHVLHLLYDTKALNSAQAERFLKLAAQLQTEFVDASGLAAPIACDWTALDDSRFEDLCYDVIRAHPMFDPNTIRKLGKTRSRDGGRDIEVHERRRGERRTPRKWIFQCKLVTDGSSLGARRVLDVGDMLDQFKANGFGVMTSTAIDATLYDKLSAVCAARQIREMHFSVLELERVLAEAPALRRRYFPT